MLRTKFMYVLFVWQSPDKCSGYMITEDLLMTGIKPLGRGKFVKGEFIKYLYVLIYDSPTPIVRIRNSIYLEPQVQSWPFYVRKVFRKSAKSLQGVRA